MFCQNCGKKISETGKFCGFCGGKISLLLKPEGKIPSQQINSDSNIKESTQGFWKVDEKTYEEQVKNYSNLKITKSYRGISSLLLLFSSSVTLLFILFGSLNNESFADIAILLLLAHFIFRGHKWAIVLAMVYWTYSKGSLILNSNESSASSLTQLVWWGVYIRVFWGALKVEKARSLGKIIK